MFYIKSTNNVKIAVWDWRPEGKETVVLVHGWPLSHKIFEYQIGRLCARGCRVVAIDLRGFGESDAPAAGYSYNEMATDLHQVVCALGLGEFTLAGFSMGGAVALRYMSLFQGKGVKRLMLLAAAAPCWTQRPGFPYGVTRSYADGLIRQASIDRPKLAHAFCHEQLFACPQSEWAKNWFEDIALSASGLGTIQAAIALRDEDGRRDLGAVHVPTVVIHGGKDKVVPKELAMIQHKSIANSRMFTLTNSGHGVFYDELEKFNQIFLSSILGGGQS